MALNRVLPAALALVLVRPRSWLPAATVLAGTVAVVLSLSRGAMAMTVLGLGLTVLLSAAKRLTLRKLAVVVVGTVVATLVLVKAWDTIMDRWLHAPTESAEARHKFESAASRMLADHPLGVGINQFALELDAGGYADAAGITGYDRTGIVHNIYWLTAAEMGYLGIAAFAALLLAPLFIAFRYGWRARHDVRGDVLWGLGIGLLVL